MKKGLFAAFSLALTCLLALTSAMTAYGQQQRLKSLDGTSVKPGDGGGKPVAITAEEVKKLTPLACLHVAKRETSIYRDAEAMWRAGNVHAGTFPVLERLPNGLVKTVWMHRQERTYRFVYVSAEDLAENWDETQWARSGSWSRFSWVPELCPAPPAAPSQPKR